MQRKEAIGRLRIELLDRWVEENNEVVSEAAIYFQVIRVTHCHITHSLSHSNSGNGLHAR